MSKVYLFLAEGFEETEAMTLLDVISRADIEVVTVSVMRERCVTCAHKVRIEAQAMFEEVDLSDADMLILPGGVPGSINLERHKGLCTALVNQYRQGKPVAGICAGPVVLGHLGILQGKRATCYPGFERELRGATYTGDMVTVDGNVFTGKCPAAALDFSLAIVKHFAGQEVTDVVADGMLYTK
jgi:4-methyl-5(b-hydroxyethyl)-thiazole monophosphate biosynthesis